MKEINYEFVEPDAEATIQQLRESLGGVLQGNTLKLDNESAKGTIQIVEVDQGLWLRRWKCTMFERLTLKKPAGKKGIDEKFILMYFLNPAIFNIKTIGRKSFPRGR